MEKVIRIGVIGSGSNFISDRTQEIARRIGQLIAGNKAILVCGGLGGVMKFAAKGAQEKGGMTIGILPHGDVNKANPYIDIPIATGLGESRNILVVRNSDILIAIEGRYGTLSEIAFALKLKKQVIGLNTWQLCKKSQKDDNIIRVETPEEAVQKALKYCKD